MAPTAAEVDRRELKLFERKVEASRLQIDEQRLALVKAHTEVEMLKREVEQARLQRKVLHDMWNVHVHSSVCSYCMNPKCHLPENASTAGASFQCSALD